MDNRALSDDPPTPPFHTTPLLSFERGTQPGLHWGHLLLNNLQTPKIRLLIVLEFQIIQALTRGIKICEFQSDFQSMNPTKDLHQF